MTISGANLDALTDDLDCRLLNDALARSGVAFALANRTAVLFTIGNIRHELTAQIDIAMVAPSRLMPLISDRAQEKIADAMCAVQHAVETAYSAFRSK